MMLFVIGLELEPRALWDMRHKLLGLGGLQITGTIAVIGGVAFAFGLPWQSALAIGMILSSLNRDCSANPERKRVDATPGGRSSFSVLLTQDIAVIPMLAMIPLLALPMMITRQRHRMITVVTAHMTLRMPPPIC